MSLNGVLIVTNVSPNREDSLEEVACFLGFQ